MIIAPGTKLGRYEIRSKIGEGGMGEVYLAEDMKLDRKVALKILPPEFAGDKDRMSRFVREAKSASALNHPNIITIHEIGESDRTHFIATEFIDGKTLSEYTKSNSLDFKSVLEIAIQIASALDEAHAAGIIHRDIKPDNVMIRANGLVKILDFGIAKLSGTNNQPILDGEEATAIKGTLPGMIIGTPNYMSPEQARGRGVDQQTDIFSFGVVLYEMLTGCAPFAGDTVSDIIAAILTKEPKPLENIPRELAAIVQKTLQKEKQKRYKSAKDLLDDLKEVKQDLEIQYRLGRNSASNPAEPQTQILKAQTTAEDNPRSAIQSLKSVVVLPFTNISTDEENEYFSDGLTEEIISDLSKIRALRVISRNSAMKLKGTAKHLKTITHELNVRYILDGSVRKAGNNLRISVQLIDGTTDANLWAEKYSGTLDDIFEMQESVSRSIAEALKITLSTGEIKQIGERPIADVPAYDLYLRARAKFMKAIPSELDCSIELLKQGLEIIGENELLYAALGYTYYFYFRWVSKLDENYLRLANECMQKTFAINPASSHGFSLKGMLSYSEGNMAEAIGSTKKAVELQPNNIEALLGLSVNNAMIGNYEESLKYANELCLIDPLTPTSTFVKGVAYVYQGEFSKSLPLIERAMAMGDLSPLHIWHAVIIKAWCGKIGEAIAHVDHLAEIAPGWIYTRHGLFLKHALRGEKEIALRHYTEDFEREARHDCHFALHVAHCFALVGENTKALDFLEISVHAGMVNYPFLSRFDPLLENIRGEKRFESLMKDAKRLSEKINGKRVRFEFQDKLENREEARTQILQAAATDQEKPSQDETAKSIAVLPFTNISAEAENEYFCDGLAEELLNALAKIDELKVASRTSAFSFKGKNAEISQIAQALNVKTILEGSVRRSGNKLRITVQLINAGDGYHLWSERYDRQMQDIFDVQDEITLAVVDALKLKLFGEEKADLLRRYTNNAEVYELYLKGLYHFNKWTSGGHQNSLRYFEKAIEKDPEYAPAYAKIAEYYFFLSHVGLFPPKEIITKWRAAASRALEIDARLADAHRAMAQIYFYYERDWAKAERELLRAVELSPNSSYSHQNYGVFLASRERFDQSASEIKKALELDPLSIPILFSAGATYLFDDRFDEAFEVVGRLNELEQDSHHAHWLEGDLLLANGHYEAAVKELQKSLALAHDNQLVLSKLGCALGLSGRREEAQKILHQLLETRERKYAAAFNIARVYAGLGERDNAFAWLERAIEEQNGELVYLKRFAEVGKGAYFGKNFTAEPRYQNILRRIGLPTDENAQGKTTDETTEAQTTILSPVATIDKETPAIIAKTNEQTSPDKPKAKPKWWLFGLLGLILLMSGFFANRFFTPTSKQIESIAVLPFINESGNQDAEYLSDGMTETLITSLSQLPNLNVKARSSVFRYKGKETDAQTIGKELNVQAILNGRVLQRSDDLVLYLELVDTGTGNRIWGDQYNKKLINLVSLQTEIARDVSQKLKTKLTGADEQKITRNYTENTEAYKLYLRGRYHAGRRTPQEVRKAIEYHQQAIAIDPNYALAYVGLSDAYRTLADYSGATSHEALPKAKEALTKALSLDKNLAEAHLSLCSIFSTYDYDFASAERQCKSGIELKPDDASALHFYGLLLTRLGRHEESIAAFKRALEMEPLALEINKNYGESLFYARRYEESIAQFKKTLELDPNFAPAHISLNAVYFVLGRHAECVEAYARFEELFNRPQNAALIRETFARKGWQGFARMMSETGLFSTTSYSKAFYLAELGEKDKAFVALNDAYEKRVYRLGHLKVDPRFESLRQDPRFQELLRKVGFPQ